MVNDQGRAAEPVLEALRKASSSKHAALENLLRLDAALDRPRYVAVLRGFESFLRGWEPHLRQALPEALALRFDESCRLQLLRRDLLELGAAPSTASLHLPSRLPLPDTAAALGSWYVLAGSALGGQVISRRLSVSLGVTPDRGGAYFHGWGTDTGRRWREFRELLAREVPDSAAARAEAAQSACATFDLLIETFQQMQHEPAVA